MILDAPARKTIEFGMEYSQSDTSPNALFVASLRSPKPFGLHKQRARYTQSRWLTVEKAI